MASPKKWPSTTLIDNEFKADDINKALLDLLDKDNQTWSIINQLAHPIGEVQIQLPGQATPASLYGGTWLNITSLYAGLFFRAEGGNALAFGAGTQAHAFQGHLHNFYLPLVTTGGTRLSFSAGITQTGSGVNALTGTSPVIDAITDGVNGTPNVANETRPINQSIRIWKKSAN